MFRPTPIMHVVLLMLNTWPWIEDYAVVLFLSVDIPRAFLTKETGLDPRMLRIYWVDLWVNIVLILRFFFFTQVSNAEMYFVLSFECSPNLLAAEGLIHSMGLRHMDEMLQEILWATWCKLKWTICWRLLHVEVGESLELFKWSS